MLAELIKSFLPKQNRYYDPGYWIELFKAKVGGKYLKRWQVTNPRTGKKSWKYKYKPLSQRGAHEITLGKFKKVTKIADETHKAAVEKALQEGHSISMHILKDYPDLIKKYNKSAKVRNFDRISAKVKEIKQKVESARKESNKNTGSSHGTYASDLYSHVLNKKQKLEDRIKQKEKFIENIKNEKETLIASIAKNDAENEIYHLEQKIKSLSFDAKDNPEYSEILDRKIKNGEQINPRDFIYFPEHGADYLKKNTGSEFYYDEELSMPYRASFGDIKVSAKILPSGQIQYSVNGRNPEVSEFSDFRNKLKTDIADEISKKEEDKKNFAINEQIKQKQSEYNKTLSDLKKKMPFEEIKNQFQKDGIMNTPKSPGEWQTAIDKLKQISSGITKNDKPVKPKSSSPELDKARAELNPKQKWISLKAILNKAQKSGKVPDGLEAEVKQAGRDYVNHVMSGDWTDKNPVKSFE
jgi:hypothetical protein